MSQPSTSPGLQSLTKQLKSKWSLLAQSGASLASAIAVFVLPPPAVLRGGDTSMVGFARFVTAMALGLCLFLASRYRSRRALTRWAVAAAVLMIFSMAGFFFYQHLRDEWTASYAGERVAIGNVLTEQGRRYLSLPQNQSMSPDAILWNAGGKVQQIWTHDSVQSCWERLSALYVCLFPVLTASIVSVLQLFPSAKS